MDVKQQEQQEEQDEMLAAIRANERSKKDEIEMPR